MGYGVVIESMTNTKLSPKMIDMLTWLACENRPVLVANVKTIDALIKRGLIEYVPGWGYSKPVMVTDAGRAAVAQ